MKLHRQWMRPVLSLQGIGFDTRRLTNCITKCAPKSTRLFASRSSSADAGISAAQKEAATRPPWFYVPPPLPSSIGSTLSLDGQEAWHAVKVLRLRPGDPVQLCDGVGGLVGCQVVATDKSSATLETVSDVEQVGWVGPRWTLAVACTTLKGGRTDWMVEKATEMGAHRFIPVVTERSQAGSKNKFKTSSRNPGWGDEAEGGRLERLSVAAAKQSLRPHLMQLLPPLGMGDLVELVGSCQVALVAAAGGTPVVKALGGLYGEGKMERGDGGERVLIVGPEGDFTPQELDALIAAGALPVGLGSNRLRTETAALSLLAAASLVDEC